MKRAIIAIAVVLLHAIGLDTLAAQIDPVSNITVYAEDDGSMCAGNNTYR